MQLFIETAGWLAQMDSNRLGRLIGGIALLVIVVAIILKITRKK
jgi:hypothetical protein